MPDINWSESVEVIGKTRLDAFEKYIQDLPRSRNRGLMVVSICWKEGSSKDGLEGIKEVAKKYKEGKRVGFVQLLSGVDLYICPRSDTIITILAKHGFFKGKVAVEDNQDSLIGCVVWRKTLPSDSSTKRSEEKNVSKLEQPPGSTSNSTAQHLDSKNTPSAAPNQESIPPESVNGQITTKSEGNNIKENENPESSTAQPELGSSHSGASRAESPTVSSSSIPAGQQAFPPADVAMLYKTIMQLSEFEASVFQSLGLAKLKANLELLKTTLPPPTSEDDDLPEYDFKTTVHQAMSSKSSQAEATDERPQAEGVRDYNGSLPWKIGIVGKMPPSRAPQDVYEGSPLQKLVQELESQIPSLLDLQQKRSMNCTKWKSLFNDDDMPEWQPPDFELPKRPVEQKTGPSFAANAFPVPKLSFLNSIPGHLPPPHPATPSMQLPFPAKTFAHACPHSTALSERAASPLPLPPVSGYIQRDPDSRVCTSNPVLRPQLDPRGHIRLPGWRGQELGSRRQFKECK